MKSNPLSSAPTDSLAGAMKALLFFAQEARSAHQTYHHIIKSGPTADNCAPRQIKARVLGQNQSLTDTLATLNLAT